MSLTQSRSKPSKPYVAMNCRKPLMNFCRLSDELAILEKASRVGPGSVKDHLHKLARFQLQLDLGHDLPSDRYPSLQALVLILQGCESVKQLSRVRVHWHDLESSRVEEGECEVDVCETIEVEVFGLNLRSY